MIIRARDIIPWWWDNVVLVFQDEEGERRGAKSHRRGHGFIIDANFGPFISGHKAIDGKHSTSHFSLGGSSIPPALLRLMSR